MPDKEIFSCDNAYFESVKNIKSSPPTVSKLDYFKNAWVAGDKVFAISSKGNICSGSVSDTNFKEHSNVVVTDRILKARTAAFGTIIETNAGLSTLLSGELKIYESDHVSWRVFPRARNYANQLHIIKDKHIELVIIESKDDEIFGFDTEKIDLKG